MPGGSFKAADQGGKTQTEPSILPELRRQGNSGRLRQLGFRRQNIEERHREGEREKEGGHVSINKRAPLSLCLNTEPCVREGKLSAGRKNHQKEVVSKQFPKLTKDWEYFPFPPARV